MLQFSQEVQLKLYSWACCSRFQLLGSGHQIWILLNAIFWCVNLCWSWKLQPSLVDWNCELIQCDMQVENIIVRNLEMFKTFYCIALCECWQHFPGSEGKTQWEDTWTRTSQLSSQLDFGRWGTSLCLDRLQKISLFESTEQVRLRDTPFKDTLSRIRSMLLVM